NDHAAAPAPKSVTNSRRLITHSFNLGRDSLSHPVKAFLPTANCTPVFRNGVIRAIFSLFAACLLLPNSDGRVRHLSTAAWGPHPDSFAALNSRLIRSTGRRGRAASAALRCRALWRSSG